MKKSILIVTIHYNIFRLKSWHLEEIPKGNQTIGSLKIDSDSFPLFYEQHDSV